MKTRAILLQGILAAAIPSCLLLAAAGSAPSSTAGSAAGRDGGKGAGPFSDVVAPFLRKHCIRCHREEKARGSLELDAYRGVRDVLEDRETWKEVVRRLEAGEMPPAKQPRPAREEIASVTEWVRARFARADRDRGSDPGRVTIRRLNRTEYANTVRDLLGVEVGVEGEFPADDVGYGFDNIGDVLSMPPILLEKYLNAAEKIAARCAKQRGGLLERLAGKRGASQGTGVSKRRRRALEALVSRAYRRPASRGEVDSLLDLAARVRKAGGSREDVFRAVLEALLVSPHFLFRVERDPDPGDPKAVHPVTDFELATRLSYFLWSTMPDAKLFELARKGTLHEDAVLEAQVGRMLRDARSGALVQNFAAQWLQIRRLESAAPDPGSFPTFDEELREAMRRETELFFEAILREDRSVLELLDADFTFVNERLAKHYGIEGVQGAEFQRVSLAGTPRGGVLTQASVLTCTSNPTRTSPVKRGKWVLEVLLGTSPPPPPANVPELSEKPEAVLSGSLRKRMEQHRADPACSPCHVRMDPLGFGLENFDGVGAWRDKDGAFPIDPSGKLPDGRTFRGPRDLRRILVGQKDEFRRCLAERLLTYATGRGMEPYDAEAVRRIARDAARSGDRFSALVLAVVRSDPFRLRRGDGGGR